MYTLAIESVQNGIFLEVIAREPERAEKALRSYLGDFYGAREAAVRMDADTYCVAPSSDTLLSERIRILDRDGNCLEVRDCARWGYL